MNIGEILDFIATTKIRANKDGKIPFALHVSIDIYEELAKYISKTQGRDIFTVRKFDGLEVEVLPIADARDQISIMLKDNYE